MQNFCNEVNKKLKTFSKNWHTKSYKSWPSHSVFLTKLNRTYRRRGQGHYAKLLAAVLKSMVKKFRR